MIPHINFTVGRVTPCQHQSLHHVCVRAPKSYHLRIIDQSRNPLQCVLKVSRRTCNECGHRVVDNIMYIYDIFMGFINSSQILRIRTRFTNDASDVLHILDPVCRMAVLPNKCCDPSSERMVGRRSGCATSANAFLRLLMMFVLTSCALYPRNPRIAPVLALYERVNVPNESKLGL